jgi:hypothetical protein
MVELPGIAVKPSQLRDGGIGILVKLLSGLALHTNACGVEP